MSTERGFVNLQGDVVTAEEAERHVALDDRVDFEYAVDAGFCTFRPPFGWVVDMDRDRFGNTIPAGEDRAAREGWWCP
jgi:hypothetical protein